MLTIQVTDDLDDRYLIRLEIEDGSASVETVWKPTAAAYAILDQVDVSVKRAIYAGATPVEIRQTLVDHDGRPTLIVEHVCTPEAEEAVARVIACLDERLQVQS